MNYLQQTPPEGYYQLPPPGYYNPPPSGRERGPSQGLLEGHLEEAMDGHRSFFDRIDHYSRGDFYDEAHLPGDDIRPDQ